MKLLFDQNLSPRLVNKLAELYPGSSHVSLVGLDRAADFSVWEYAKANGYTLVTRDVDFSDLAISRGFPPKIIWIRRGNCSTADIEGILRTSLLAIQGLTEDSEVAILELF